MVGMGIDQTKKSITMFNMDVVISHTSRLSQRPGVSGNQNFLVGLQMNMPQKIVAKDTQKARQSANQLRLTRMTDENTRMYVTSMEDLVMLIEM
jgi:hypothetical protein